MKDSIFMLALGRYSRFPESPKISILTKNWYFYQSSRLAAPGYIEVMDLTAIIQIIDEEIARLEQIRALLSGHTAPLKRGFPPSEASDPPRKRRKISAEGLARIRAGQKARWSKFKKR
jgi:hypothetical protein